MAYNKVIRGKANGVIVNIELPDEVPDAEKLLIIRQIQNFVNQFESVEEFCEVMNTYVELEGESEEWNH